MRVLVVSPDASIARRLSGERQVDDVVTVVGADNLSGYSGYPFNVAVVSLGSLERSIGVVAIVREQFGDLPCLVVGEGSEEDLPERCALVRAPLDGALLDEKLAEMTVSVSAEVAGPTTGNGGATNRSLDPWDLPPWPSDDSSEQEASDDFETSTVWEAPGDDEPTPNTYNRAERPKLDAPVTEETVDEPGSVWDEMVWDEPEAEVPAEAVPEPPRPAEVDESLHAEEDRNTLVRRLSDKLLGHGETNGQGAAATETTPLAAYLEGMEELQELLEERPALLSRMAVAPEIVAVLGQEFDTVAVAMWGPDGRGGYGAMSWNGPIPAPAVRAGPPDEVVKAVASKTRAGVFTGASAAGLAPDLALPGDSVLVAALATGEDVHAIVLLAGNGYGGEDLARLTSRAQQHAVSLALAAHLELLGVQVAAARAEFGAA